MPPTERRWPEDAALLVQVGQAVQVELAVDLAGLGDHQVAALQTLAHDLHGPGVEQVAQAVGGDRVGLEAAAGRGQVDRGQHLEHIGLLAGLDSGPGSPGRPDWPAGRPRTAGPPWPPARPSRSGASRRGW